MICNDDEGEDPLFQLVTLFFGLCRYGQNAKVVHFLGKVKPWNYSYDAQRGEVRGHSVLSAECQMHPDFLLRWWQLYARSVQPLLQKAYGDAPFNSGFIHPSSHVGDRSGTSVRRGCGGD